MPSTPISPVITQDGASGPSNLWLALGFLLAGLGTVLLGPVLPTVTARWHLSDATAGTLLFAKFVGAFAGGSTVPRRLRSGILSATLYTAGGLLGFAMSASVWTGAPALILMGFGLGRLIASSNILTGHRFPARTSAALARMNFFWSFGAVSTGVLVGWLLPLAGLRGVLLGFAFAFVLVGLGGRGYRSPGSMETTDETNGKETRLPRSLLLYFGGLLVLYGGLETSLSSWLSTFDARYLNTHVLGSQTLLVLFWLALTAGRALSAAALQRWAERTVLRASLLCVVGLIVALATLHGEIAILSVCACLGIALAPWFPATFGTLLRLHPGAREAGFILALSGIGAAIFPWLTGVVSTHVGSLRTAMAVPALLAVALFSATLLQWNAAQESS